MAPTSESRTALPSNPPPFHIKPNSTTQRANGKHTLQDSSSSPFRVNAATGAVTLTVPTVIPFGRENGCTPNPQLVYNSLAGNGHFGIGWTLALSGISRKTSQHVPYYTDEDVFVLAGAEDLVLDTATTQRATTRNGYIVRFYRPRVQINATTVRIERWTSCTDGNDEFWRTISSTGLITLYGRNDSSRVFDPCSGTPRLFSWLPSVVYDTKGNSTLYGYKKEDSANVDIAVANEQHRSPKSRGAARYLKKIKYCNQTPFLDYDTWITKKWEQDEEDYLFEVVFDYGEHAEKVPTVNETSPWPVRDDVMSSYHSGFEIRTYRLCRRVLLFHHFPATVTDATSLVSSAVLQYNESPSGSVLISVTRNGHRIVPGAEGICSESQAPLKLEYSVPQLTGSSVPITVETSSLAAIPQTEDARAQWIDLDGEGSPGILAQRPGGESIYMRNESQGGEDPSVVFGPPRVLRRMPNLLEDAETERGFFTHLAADGTLQFVYMGQERGVYGYYPRREHDWDQFVPFAEIPSADMADVHWVDLVGNGRQDVVEFMVDDQNHLRWYPSLGYEGFGPARLADGPNLPPPTSDAYAIRLADMTGDGLTDVVYVCNSDIAYWPNLGHGRFGARVRMDRSPRLDGDGNFTSQRVLLADVDGSGTTDLIYLTPGGGASVYVNQSGNSWSNPIILGSVPDMSEMNSINVVDILGQGLPCLCWTLPSSRGHGPITLQYMQLMGPESPHQLTKYTNGAGLETSLEYCPSTKFYLADEKAARPWATRLPFPVRCLSKITHIDHIAQTKSQSSFAYHEGFYDSVECEFRGFGNVDCWESEDLAAAAGLPKIQAPPRHTRTWHHTGSPFYDAWYDQSGGSEAVKLGPTQTPAAAPAELREAKRALKGMMLRSEIRFHSDEGDTILEVSQKNYSVVMERGIAAIGRQNPLSESPHGCFRVLDRELLTKTFERCHTEEARLQHHMTLSVNQNGQPTKTAVIRYARQKIPDGLDERTKTRQGQAIINYLEHDYTNPLDEADAFATCQPSETRSYRVRGVELPHQALLFSFDELSDKDAAFFREAPDVAFDQDPDPSPPTPKCKILISQERAYYRSGDMKVRLALGTIEPFSVLDQKYNLALTKGLLSNVLVSESHSSLLAGLSASDGAYVDLQADGNWWMPSSTNRYCDPSKPWDALAEIRAARSHFYIPEYTIDARGAVTYQGLDSFNFLRTKTVNAVGDENYFSYNYPFKEPVRVIDANDNISEFAYDCFGALVGTAVKGKTTESLGDSLDGFASILTESQIMEFWDKPLDAAPALLGLAGSRRIYHRSQTLGVPAFEAEIHRFKHSKSPATIGEFSVSIQYSDGRGNTIQTAILHDSSPQPQWRLEGWQIRGSNHNQAVLTFHPYLTSSHKYCLRTDTGHPLPPATCSIYDPLNRLVAILHPDNTWQTTTIEPWRTVNRDAGDNVLVQDMATDSGVGIYIAASINPQSYMPGWYSVHTSSTASDADKAAAKKARVYSDTPDISHLDSEGREILSVTSDNSAARQTARSEFDSAGNTVAVFDTLGRAVIKSQYDLCRRQLSKSQLDGRVDLALPDALGLDWLQWAKGDEGYTRQRTEHDGLGRPLRIWLQRKSDHQNERLIIRYEYGEAQPNAKAKNLRGQLYKTADQSGISTNVAYDFTGNLTQHDTRFAKEYKSVIDWSTDGPPDERLETETYTDNATYDAQNRPYLTTAVDGSRITRSYNVSGGLVSVKVAHKDSPDSWKAYITGITYTAFGREDNVAYGNGVSKSYTYNPLTLLVSRCTTWKQGRGGRVVFRDIHTTYDCLDKRVYVEDQALQDVYFRNKVIQPINDYTYDARGQVIIATGREKFDAEKNTVQPYGPQYDSQGDIPSDDQLCAYTDNINYDAVGNITSMQHVTGDAKVSGWTRTYDYADGNRLRSTRVGRLEDVYTYNARGSMTSMPGVTSMTWDFADRLRSTTSQKVREAGSGSPETAWYIYNAAGTRVRKVTERGQRPEPRVRETLYLRQLVGFQVYREFSGQENTLKSQKTTLEVTASVPSSDSRPIGLIEYIESNLSLSSFSSSSSPPKQVLLERYLLDQGLEIDDEGNLLSLEEYSVYGATTFRAAGKRIQAPSCYRYSGYVRDTGETGLYFCETRYYAPWLGRWTSPDGILAGLNLYRYVSNDPVNSADPHGTMDGPGGDDDGWVQPARRARGRGARGEAAQAQPAQAAPAAQPAQAAQAAPADPDLTPNLGLTRTLLPAPTDNSRIQVWQSIVDFGRTPPSRGQLLLAVRKAYRQMAADHAVNGVRKQPSVMTAFAPASMPGTVFFSSSATAADGGAQARFYYEGERSEPRLREMLTAEADARVVGNRVGHHRTGACGELGAINLALRTDPNMGLAGTIVAYGVRGTPGNAGPGRPPGGPANVMNRNQEPSVVPPCGGGLGDNPPDFGCAPLLQRAGIEDVIWSSNRITIARALPNFTIRR